ncbi:hypothetical protein S7711_03369 [Stachybotrys chartarum IBT 7711]|uniref:Uncharacterized protein n=1 Tax=Stachybotrys chartarum (strain CBS 109288 / IBT 7711) TaxID=1280523 RepID=A0A084AXV4_STACB|nr:hypothetical protein S7711_03369 [Stachybotrys chartarum IBT 7711]KFA46824.1 hypothetical protein S40293_05591 [Stachybotrys chartarum IBT 40293]
MDKSNVHIAVVGAGPAGLAAVKSLAEEGFDVTCFDNRDAAGGIWRFSEDPTVTSVTGYTRTQLSKFLLSYSDFPIPEDYPRHVSAAQLSAYYQSYAKAFNLDKKIRYNSTVVSIRRSPEDAKWLLYFKGESEPKAFDKVVFAHGSEHVRKYPAIENQDAFEGIFIHGQEYKRPGAFKDMNVIVMGQGNSAGDCVNELVGHASNIYLAHSRGTFIIPRMIRGARLDATGSWMFTRFGFWLGHMLPDLQNYLMGNFFVDLVRKAWGKLDSSWGFDPHRSFAQAVSGMMINDSLIPAFRAGTVKPTAAIRKILGPKTVELTDGTVLEHVDAIIACTGYAVSLELARPALSYNQTHPQLDPFPDLYFNIFPVDHADSIACLGYTIVLENAATAREVAAMAVAQVWAGKSALPPRAAMLTQVRRHQAWLTKQCTKGPIAQHNALTMQYEWFRFVNDTAGTGLYEHFGWGWTGWMFYLTNPSLYYKLVYGVNTPHMLRLFETGKRKAWDGALEAVLRTNEMSAADLKESKLEAEKAKQA